MAANLDNYLDLLQQKKAFADLATIMPDGTPQVTPVWFDYAGGKVRVNTAKGRVKARNLQPGAAVALSISFMNIVFQAPLGRRGLRSEPFRLRA